MQSFFFFFFVFGIMKWAYLWGLSMLTCQNRDAFISGGVFWFLCSTFFILHYFHVALCATCGYSTLFLLHFALHPFCAHFFRVTLFSYCTFFIFNNFHVAFFFFYILLLLHSLHVALFSYCAFFTFFIRSQYRSKKTSWSKNLFKNNYLFHYQKQSPWRCSVKKMFLKISQNLQEK